MLPQLLRDVYFDDQCDWVVSLQLVLLPLQELPLLLLLLLWILLLMLLLLTRRAPHVLNPTPD
jgi:hypothetical protein